MQAARKKWLMLALALLPLLAGCGGRDPANTASSTTAATLDFDGRQRHYYVHLPPGYDGSQPTPLVLGLHPAETNAQIFMDYSGISSAADGRGMIVVYPDGTGPAGSDKLTWNAGICCGNAMLNRVDDLGFIGALLDKVEHDYNVDTKRVYATGHSNGGFLSFYLACNMAGRIAAIGPVAGALATDDCRPSQPVAVIDFHGDADNVVPYDGFGLPIRKSKQSVAAAMDFWSGFDKCAATPATTTAGDVKHDTYSGCGSGTGVELYTIVGGGHGWPGTEQNGANLDPAALILDFFQSHP